MAEYLLINPLMGGIAGGIIGAIITFLTTIIGVLGYSDAAKTMESTVWKRYGYKVSWFGSIWGAIIGFVYAFLICWVFFLIYNVLI
ncbi:unnamed protein product [marine sediment metagenome]|uniref:Uncharacterized protein n=1 Tax=marine sediment metagenome TaxID=412755 RepID=X1G580_9ZZZZ